MNTVWLTKIINNSDWKFINIYYFFYFYFLFFYFYFHFIYFYIYFFYNFFYIFFLFFYYLFIHVSRLKFKGRNYSIYTYIFTKYHLYLQSARITIKSLIILTSHSIKRAELMLLCMDIKLTWNTTFIINHKP